MLIEINEEMAERLPILTKMIGRKDDQDTVNYAIRVLGGVLSLALKRGQTINQLVSDIDYSIDRENERLRNGGGRLMQ